MQNRKRQHSGFSLIEVSVAIILLGIICSSVFVVINRSLEASDDMRTKYRAFEIARENMEQLLSRPAVENMTEFGTSERYPQIEWETRVETFYEPITSNMWVRGICSAYYYDSLGEQQQVELTSWLTGVSKEQLTQVMAEKEKERLLDFGFEGREQEFVPQDSTPLEGMSPEQMQQLTPEEIFERFMNE